MHDLTGFGTNPGALKARYYLPATIADSAPLVVVLHGCTQNASGYDRGAGWSQLADEHGFALLFPEQQRSNNPNLCFNWFSPIDSRQDGGEAQSIRQMIAAMVATYAIDERRMFVTGLSAGGAMASIMLARYPDLFAGGAIIAGLPFGAAASVGDAFARMRGDGYPSDAALGALVRDASDHDGPWPTISIWQGSADKTVAPSNAQRIIAQWQAVHDVGDILPERAVIEGSDRLTWRDRAGRPVIESYIIPGLGHGTPLHTIGPDGCGASAPYMLEAGISSTRHIARAWGLALNPPKAKHGTGPSDTVDRRTPSIAAPDKPMLARAPQPVGEQRPTGISAIIEDALRKAGLLR
ncbi:MAG: PHB depolymerase family esterase [bacterium]|nr:PHB depolymerase family esterase [bacterium]